MSVTTRWTATDWRKAMGLIALSCSGPAATFLAWQALMLTAERSTGPWPTAYFGFGCLILISIVQTGLSAILGRRMFTIKVGDKEIGMVGEEEASRIEEHLK